MTLPGVFLQLKARDMGAHPYTVGRFALRVCQPAFGGQALQRPLLLARAQCFPRSCLRRLHALEL